MHHLALAGLLPALMAASGAAQEPTLFTERHFLAVLDAAHPAVRERQEAMAAARARNVESRVLANPVLGAVSENPEGPGEQVDWTLSWQLPGADRRPRVASTAAAVRAAEIRLAQDLLDLRIAMRSAYADWAIAASREDHLQRSATHLRRLAERQAERAERGEVSGLEARRLALEAGELDARLALAAARTRETLATLAEWHPGIPTGARAVLPEIPRRRPVEQEHPSIRAARDDLSAATLALDAERRWVDSPEVTLGWQRQETGVERLDGPIVGLAWAVPLLDRQRGEQALAEARVVAATARLERLIRRIEVEREAALANHRALARALAETAADLEGNAAMLAAAGAAYRHGESSLTDLLDIERSVTASELGRLDLYAAALAADRRLEGLAGASPRLHESTTPRPQEPSP